MLIGVTGSIGAGKSFVAGLLGNVLGAEVLSADEICRQQLEKDRGGYAAVVDRWGTTYLDESQEIDRVRLRRAVFQDPDVRRQLEDILHPLVREQVLDARQAAGPERFVVAEVPLLYESGWEGDFDWVVCVSTALDLAVARVARRDGADEGEVLTIIGTQMPSAEKQARADAVIDNSDDPEKTRDQVVQLAEFLRNRFSENST